MQKVFRTHGAKVSQESLAPCATLFCTGARGFSLPGFKRPFAPSPNHFRAFSYFRPLSQALWFATLGTLFGLVLGFPRTLVPGRWVAKPKLQGGRAVVPTFLWSRNSRILVLPKAPRRTKNTTHSKFTTRSECTIAL